MARKPMQVLAEEYAARHVLALMGEPDLVEAFKAGWRASTANRWPKAKLVKRSRHRVPVEHEWDTAGNCKWCPAVRSQVQHSADYHE